MSALSEYFLNSLASIVQLDCFVISHSAFTSTKFLVRNAAQGIHVTHEDTSEHDYEYCPMLVERAKSLDNLDQIYRVSLGDLGEIIPAEIDAIKTADSFNEKPVVVYRAYRSDQLTSPLYGPYVLELKNFDFSREGCTFDAMAPSLNVARTGERYSQPRFPMLKGLL
jgi:hypothetical protein